MLFEFARCRCGVSVGAVGIGALLLASSVSADTSEETKKNSLSKRAAIRLAAKCIRDCLRNAEPNSNLKLDDKSAVARYYHKAKAYDGNSLWLIGFPEADGRVEEDSDAKNAHTGLFRLVWVEDDGSYSGNCRGELPPTTPPVLLGPDDEAQAIEFARAFLGRHYPKMDINQRPPIATYNRDNASFGGAPLWIVGFSVPVASDERFKVGMGPRFYSQGVWVTRDGLVMLGGALMMGPARLSPHDEVNTRKPAP